MAMAMRSPDPRPMQTGVTTGSPNEDGIALALQRWVLPA